MQNQITIKDNNGQSINVNLISHFKIKSTGKEYVVYDKGENVNGGIKIYVEDTSINTIDQNIWETQIKPLIGNIIKGVDNPDLEYVGTGNELLITDVNGPKIVVMTQEFIDSLKNEYSKNNKPVETNAEALSNVFGGESNAPQTSVENQPPVQQPENEIKFTSPGVNFGAKSNEAEKFADQPASLSSTPSQVEIPVAPTPSAPVVETPNATPTNESALNTQETPNPTNEIPVNPVEQNTETISNNIPVEPINNPAPMESPFNVNPGTNMFDTNPVPSETTTPVQEPVATVVPQTSLKTNQTNLTSDIEFTKKLLEIAKKKLENAKEEVALYEDYLKVLETGTNTKEESTNLENTAVNLFDNNGALNAQALEFDSVKPTLNI